jgi:hypothetical protein
MPQTYRPKLDVFPVLGSELSSQYQQLTGILRWAIELCRVNILLEVSLLSSSLCQPREGHLKAVYNIFAYLEKYIKATMAFDNKPPWIVKDAFHQTDWSKSVYDKCGRRNPHQLP